MTPELTGTEVTPEVAGRITACRNHLGEVQGAWGPTVAGHCALTLVNSLSGLFGIARDGGTIGTAGDLGLWANRLMYCEMVPFRMSARDIRKVLGNDYDEAEIARLLHDGFVCPLEWSVHS
jgi:hypothetical protein